MREYVMAGKHNMPQDILYLMAWFNPNGSVTTLQKMKRWESGLGTLRMNEPIMIRYSTEEFEQVLTDYKLKLVIPKIAELITRVLSDSLPEKIVDAAYVFSQTKYNYPPPLQVGVNLIQTGKARELLSINISDKIINHVDVNQLMTELNLTCSIELLKFKKGSNTYTEAEKLVAEAKRREWKRVIIVAPIFHQVRCFVSMVSAARKKKYPELKIYNYPWVPINWNQKTVHSQGEQEVDKAKELIPDELRKTLEYENLLPVSEVLDYLDRRDA